jgi:SAM-dependent methyltransferase
MKARLKSLLSRDWHRKAVGGLWELVGKLQFDFLVKNGLKPRHYFLDVGCGSLRGGVHFVNYLETGHYFGVDINKALLEKGKVELKRNKLTQKAPTLMQMGDFGFQRLDQKFDYALAQSVFTHLPLNSVIRCIVSIQDILKQDGRFYATFFENSKGKSNLEPILHPRVDGTPLPTYFDKDPYHYDFETFKWICRGTSLEVEYIGEWGHPRDQRMMLFTKT